MFPLLRKQPVQNPDPLPPLARMMVFIDGENLVARYEAMQAAGRTPRADVQHQKDVYVWAHGAVWPGVHIVQRATFYTYVQGSEQTAADASAAIKALTFGQYSAPGHGFPSRLVNTLYPRVFRKTKNRPGKAVDIQMTVDCLGHAYHNNLDTVYLVSGDGDYEPLIAECQRLGKSVFVAALSSGLSKTLPTVADRFIDLDNFFFD